MCCCLGARERVNIQEDLDDNSAADAAQKQNDDMAKMMGFSGFGKLKFFDGVEFCKISL